jgi:hypothetical protein
MDEAFSFVAAAMPRPRAVTAFTVRLAAMIAVALALLIAFASFVVTQERAGNVRRAAAVQEQHAQQEAEARAAAEEATSTDPIGADAAPSEVAGLLNQQARDAATGALETAQEIAATSSLAESAGTAQLTAAQPDVLFVDGPSTAPSIVSIYTGAAGWAAAVHGAAHACYWVAVTPEGATRYGIGRDCTGMAALAADRSGW